MELIRLHWGDTQAFESAAYGLSGTPLPIYADKAMYMAKNTGRSRVTIK